MKTLKIGLANLQGKMTRKEMKDVYAGAEGINDKDAGVSRCYNSYTHCNVDGDEDGNCETRTDGRCVCNNGYHSIISSACLK